MKNGENCNKWKIATFVLLGIVILETLFLSYVINLGTDIIEKETECVMNICGDEKFTAYYYDSYENMCYCYEGNEITHQKYMK